jgi:hypothetical protein
MILDFETCNNRLEMNSRTCLLLDSKISRATPQMAKDMNHTVIKKESHEKYTFK